MPSFPILPRHDLTAAEVDGLEDRLHESNVQATGYDDGRGLGFVVHDEDGELVGAVAGHTWGGVAEIKQVWVREGFRGRGLASGLMGAALDEARRRGCELAWVMSYDFQAPGFYERLDFERVAELPDWPIGRTQVILRKRLVTP